MKNAMNTYSGRITYAAPQIESVEIMVEAGIAQSPGDENYNRILIDMLESDSF